ncbi:hypothetical protein RISK_001939 [Rhodopirellula islandica]|uniref:Uncharacterized protein n=1 Tax=Rhodopirellula islandica TaxID=595434 RepID=A0A0J1BHY5_RHOIS|nr:hypothetical protein RISK_001939 [Rhodopirellula islandica]
MVLMTTRSPSAHCVRFVFAWILHMADAPDHSLPNPIGTRGRKVNSDSFSQ